jgi:hypothetical protein
MRVTQTMMAKIVLLGVLATPIQSIPAHGQQEVDPTWYNPWPDASKPTAKPMPTKIAEHKDANRTHKNHVSTTQAKKKQPPAKEPLRTAEALPPVKN